MQICKIGPKIKGYHGGFCVPNALKFKAVHNKQNYSFIFGGILNRLYNFNENCLTILIFYSNLKSDKCDLIGSVFKVCNQNWLLFGSISSLNVDMSQMSYSWGIAC
jgi:hypothetical protein